MWVLPLNYKQMTKVFDIIYLNNEMYMVDKKYEHNSLVIYGKEIFRVRERNLYDFPTMGWRCMPNQNASILPYDRIVATTDKSLGLPLLPAIEEESLNPLPTYVEVYTENHNIGGGYGLAHKQPLQSEEKPMVDFPNKIVQVKQWIYE